MIAIIGESAMQMNGLNELVVLVLNNRDLNMVSWEQRVTEGAPKFPGSQDLPDFSYASFAELLGIRGRVVSRPDDVADAWHEVLASDRPVLLEAIVDPDVPPLPPHTTLEQARNYLKAIIKGDPGAMRIIKASIKEMLA